MILGIVGTGLIGGSIGIRARELGWRVQGYDANVQAAEEAVRCGAIDEAVSRERIDECADVLVVAAHSSATIGELERLRAAPPRNAKLILDISSVKAPVVDAARGLENFVATHPMAGRECSGPSAATRDLFEGKTWLYVPTGDRELDRRAVEFIGSFGAVPVEVDAREHDRITAQTSHVPQVFASVFAGRLEQSVRCEVYMGPAARELVRLSRSSSAMWADILDANRENVCKELRELASDLLRIAQDLESGKNIYRQATGR